MPPALVSSSHACATLSVLVACIMKLKILAWVSLLETLETALKAGLRPAGNVIPSGQAGGGW